MPTPSLTLKGFTFAELFHAEGLQRLDQAFLAKLKQQHNKAYQQLLAYREKTLASSPLEISELLIT